ncbi:cell division protein FtsQ/DivIB [Labrys monachus]|uniref:Cell division protein FtsQ n=1 Tax=Labrys monachus TaxID=217067 RepID=A0ABU0FL60_9HYPH|nr:cell division protein FtsQ/DivIB [Labrys monachus]MDQ0395256.1 cell division protein FtsQ [Labrys monachus]
MSHPPRGLGLVLTAALFSTTIVYGAKTGPVWPQLEATYGAPPDMAANFLGFRVETVAVNGQHELTDQQIFAAAGVTGTSSLLFLDAEAAREGLEALPLVKSAQVRKLFPDTLSVSLEERKPYALWQRDGTVTLIAEDGTVIEPTVSRRFADLPLVVGEGADKRAHEIVPLLAATPMLAGRVKGATLVSQRRWNLTLDNGVVVRLPEEDPGTALKNLALLEREASVLEKDILAVDMRQSDRAVFRLSEQAAAARAAALGKKAPKKGDHV